MTVDTYTISASGKASIIKDPNAVLDYSLDLTEWLGDTGDLVTALVTEAEGVTVESTSIQGAIVTAWVSGGVVGEAASVTFRFTTDSVPARTDDRTVHFKIRER